jgi:uncharacterized damage-inducible protein DinB
MAQAAERILAEFDVEMDRLRATLERIPAGRLDWRPHPRARSLGALALHLATIPAWVGSMLEADAYDLALAAPSKSEEGDSERDPAWKDAILALFEANLARARAAIAGRSDDELAAPWRLERSGTVRRTLPRSDVLRVFLLDHLIHHRGQLVVYLRMLDVPVPALYGDSADEGG